MSAPAGWHLQPDGQERYWDGTAWTDQFRAPLPSDPTAPPPPSSWAASADETQALDVDHTQAIPAPTRGAGAAGLLRADTRPGPAGPWLSAGRHGYRARRLPAAGLPPSRLPADRLRHPDQRPYAPPPRQGNALAKGCLIAALIGVLVLGAAVVGGIYVFNQAADTISETFPSGLPTDLPTDFPTDLPTEGLGESVDVTVGGGFELPRATIESGWVLEPQGGVAMVQITGMKARLTSDDDFPVLFTMSFPDAGGGQVETVCTAPSGTSGATVDVSCVPLFGDVGDATRARVTASL